jgi:hypothetical protein
VGYRTGRIVVTLTRRGEPPDRTSPSFNLRWHYLANHEQATSALRGHDTSAVDQSHRVLRTLGATVSDDRSGCDTVVGLPRPSRSEHP